MKRKRLKYDESLPRRMYTYFTGYDDVGAPSFAKFARLIGVTLQELTELKRHKDFERAYRECSEIRRDYLIDNALTKRHDPSFVKFLLSSEYGMGEDEPPDSELKVTLQVIS